MIVIIILILGIVWYLNKTSKNDYFFQSNEKLIEDLILLDKIYRNFEIEVETFAKAHTYFRQNPNKYNGTSVINDRWLIKGLEPLSVEHDYNWIVAKSFKELIISNLDYCHKLRKVNANWIWVWCFIFCGLNIVSIFKSIKYI